MIHKQRNMKFLYIQISEKPQRLISPRTNQNSLKYPKLLYNHDVFSFSWGDRSTQEKLERMAITAKGNEKIAVSMKSIDQIKKKNPQ